jgi:hypothetical protein
LSYARIVLGTVILITALFFLLDLAIVGYVFGAFALFVLFVVVKEGL